MANSEHRYVEDVILIQLEKWQHNSKQYLEHRKKEIKGREADESSRYTCLGYFDNAVLHKLNEEGDMPKLLSRPEGADSCAVQHMSLFSCACKEKANKYLSDFYPGGYVKNYDELIDLMNKNLTNVSAFKFSRSVYEHPKADVVYTDDPDNKHEQYRHTIRPKTIKCAYVSQGVDSKCRNNYICTMCGYIKLVNDRIWQIKKSMKGFEDLQWRVYMSMGSTDLVLFLFTEDFKKYSAVVHAIWLLTYGYDAASEKYVNKPEKLLFADSSTLYMFSRTNKKLIEGKDDEYYVLVRLTASYFMKQTKELEKVKEYVDIIEADDEKNFQKGMHGDEDYVRYFRCKLSDFFKLYIPKNEGELAYFYDAEAMKFVRYVHTEILDSFDENRENLLDELVGEAEGLVEGLLVQSDEDEEYRETFNELQKKYRNTIRDTMIPKSVIGTMDRVMEMVSVLCYDTDRFSAFVNILQVLRVYFKALEKNVNHRKINRESIIQCAQEMFNILPNMMQIDDTNMDAIKDEVSIRPFSKIYHAYQQLICELVMAKTENDYDHMNPKKNGFSPILLTVGYGGFDAKVHFATSADGATKYKERILVFSIPNVLFFDLSKSFINTLHECGHRMSKEPWRTARNVAAAEAYIGHLASMIWKELRKLKTETEEFSYMFGSTIRTIRNYLDAGAIFLDSKDMETVWIEHLARQVRRMYSSFQELYKICGYDKMRDYYGCFINYLDGLVANDNFVRPFLLSMREAEADCSMISTSDLPYVEYMKFMYSVLEEDFEDYKTDGHLHLRVSIIQLYYVFKGKNGKLDEYAKQLFTDGEASKEMREEIKSSFLALEEKIMDSKIKEFSKWFYQDNMHKKCEHFVVRIVKYLFDSDNEIEERNERLRASKCNVVPDVDSTHEYGLIGRLKQFCSSDEYPYKYTMHEQIELYYSLYFKQMQWLYCGKGRVNGD